MTKVVFKKMILSGSPVLAPADEEALETLAHFNQADDIEVTLNKIRSPKFHRKYFALIKFGHENTDSFDGNANGFRKACTILAHYYTPIEMPDGTIHLEADSIAYDKMNDTDFAKLYEATKDVILKYYLPSMEPEQLDAIIREIIGF